MMSQNTRTDIHTYSNTDGKPQPHETPEQKDDRVNLTILKLSTDRSRLREGMRKQSKLLFSQRKQIIHWRKKYTQTKIDFTELQVITQQKIKSFMKQVHELTTQNESLIQKNQSLSQCFDFTGDIDTFCPDESQPVEVTEQNKPTEGPKKRKKRISSKSKSNVRVRSSRTKK